MNKKELINVTSKKTGINKKEVALIVNTIIDTITEELKKWNDVKISGLWKFFVVKLKEREGINLQTGEKVTIPARNSVRIKASKKLKDSVK